MPTRTIVLTDDVFTPSSLTVVRGTRVTARNDGADDHDWVGPTWDSGNLAPGASYSLTFSTAGEFDFECTYHPGMDGTITVT